MHIYEYLFTAIIIFAMLIASSTIVVTISQPSTTTTDKEQLKITAQKIMTQLTLDPGDPPDWGNNLALTAQDLTTFGLAKYGETTREAYVLDPDKILRLDSANARTYIQPYSVLNLLNLATSYGLTLDIQPALTITATNTTQNTYQVTVTTNDIGFPIALADVTAQMFYMSSAQKIVSTITNTTRTGVDGRCQFTFNSTITEPKVLVLAVNYYGIRIVKTIPIGTNIAQAYLIGNHTLLNESHTVNEVTEIIAEPSTDGYMIQGITTSTTQIDALTFDLDYLEPSTMAIMAVVDGGNTLLFASKEVTITYSSIPGVTSFPFSYSLERTVTISGSAYIMRLQIWRMSF